MVNDLCLDILGTSFTITTDAEEVYLKKVLSQYKTAVNNTQNISGIKEPLNIAILTGFLLCDELNKVKQQLEELREAQGVTTEDGSVTNWEEQEVRDRTLRVITKLDQALHLFGDDKHL
jgi:cell division protein ZapA (FtsZ GTPase activity inhibitor)